MWRTAERDLDARRAAGNGHGEIEATVARLRDEYQRLYTHGMLDNMSRLHEADQRRASSTPSTPAFHQATRDTEDIAADIWEQARRGDRDTPNGRNDDRREPL